MTEYRVVWRREGRQRSTRIYQSWNAAHRKARGILALEAVKDETIMWNLPALVERPAVETREVGEWRSPDHPEIQATEYEERDIKTRYTRDDHVSGLF